MSRKDWFWLVGSGVFCAAMIALGWYLHTHLIAGVVRDLVRPECLL